jgi:GNAT superfamily N-acetyltransferase
VDCVLERSWDDGLLLRSVGADEFKKDIEPLIKRQFQTPVFEDPMHGKSSECLRGRQSFRDSRMNLYLCAYYGAELAGFHCGHQHKPFTFSMSTSVVLESFRKRGVYGRMLDIILAWTKEQGFSQVVSHHHPSNNPILIAKLKRGFVISGIEMSAQMGFLVALSYYHNPLAQKVFEFKSGRTYMDDEVRDSLYKGQ